MKTYPNQKVITINKAKADKENTYATINKECLMKAITELTHNELKIYLYLASNQNGFQLALSSADISEKTNASKRKIQESINSLIEKGYLVETGSNSYDFIEDTVYKKDTGYMYKKYTGDVHEKDTGICTKSTQDCVQKVHSNVYKKDTEILHYNTLYNTSSIIQAAEDNASETLVPEEEDNASKTLVGECINHSQDVNKTLVGDAQNTRSNASETLVEILHYNTLYNTSSIIQAAEETEEDFQKEEEKEEVEEEPKKEDTFINFLKELNCTQLQQIKDMYAKGTPYKEIASAYNIKYFDAAKFAENYDSLYKEKYNMEHPEELERRQQQEQAWRERKQAERAEDAEIADAISHIKINKHKPVQCNNKPAQSTAKAMPMIDGSAIDSRLTGITFPESMLDNINNGIITADELVEMQLGSMDNTGSNVFW